MRRFIFVISYLFFATILAASARAEEARPDTTAPDTGLDRQTRAHLEKSVTRVDAALPAGVERHLGGSGSTKL